MTRRAPNLFTIAAKHGFADTLAAAWLEACDNDPVASGDGLILLPTRRGVRALTDAFLAASRRPALLLPRIEAIGATDEAPLAMSGALDLPPAIDPLARLGALARLILARDDRLTLAAAWELAASLAELLDEAARHGVDLAAALPSLAPEALAHHWQITLDFLSVVTTHWPQALAALDLSDPAARQTRLLEAQARHWRDAPPTHPVWFAGVAAATPAETALARVIANLPTGRVILHGLDLELDDESWNALDDAHPQAGLRRLLAGLDCIRADARPLAGDSLAPPGRATLLRRALLPADSIARRWREPAALDPAGLFLLPAADEQAEAVAIALILREALEHPNRTAALVTPDRGLAQRVTAEIARFGVLADDSAGEPLSETPNAVFLRLLAATIAGGLPPATLLALLKHPFATAGLSQSECRREARRLERIALRGPRPQPGFPGLRRATEAAPRVSDTDRAASTRFIDRLESALQPLTDQYSRPRTAPADLVQALIAAAERLADTDRLWADEEGEALAAHMAGLTDALATLPPQPPACLPGLLDASLAGLSVYGRRALRGHDATAIHPRLSIWGLLEARGQTADILILGGLTEGTWPAATDPGPWMGRPMRTKVGLPSPEIAVGIAAHDFANLAGAAPTIILSYAARRDRAPAVPSRWIARLEACLAGAGLTLPVHPALGWAAALDQPAGITSPAAPPQPRPPVASRPRRLSVTEIETWLRDPYAIYARHILRLRALAPLEEEADRALFGNLVHHALAEAYTQGALDADGLQARFEHALDLFSVRGGVAAWWRPRLRRIAEWVATREAERRATAAPDHLETEISGQVVLDADAGPFTLTGRADRIERRADNLAILDYKTGTVPSKDAMRDGWSPQLPLEATMAILGGFGDAFAGSEAAELAHWKLSGGPKPGDEQSLSGPKLQAIVEDTWLGLELRINEFDDPETPYLAQPYPRRAPRYDDYAVLARVAEWRLTEDE
jgi:ATP-dependent helicase/nuclease subunit B